MPAPLMILGSVRYTVREGGAVVVYSCAAPGRGCAQRASNGVLKKLWLHPVGAPARLFCGLAGLWRL